MDEQKTEKSNDENCKNCLKLRMIPCDYRSCQMILLVSPSNDSTAAAPLDPRMPRESTPHRLVDHVLRGQGFFEGPIIAPGSHNIAKIALTFSNFANVETSSQGSDHRFIQALTLFIRR